MKSEIRLRALEQFTCLGDRCPDNCCKQNWDIRIDAQTFASWQSHAEATTLCSSTTVAERDGESVRLFSRDQQGQCVHLSNDGLCGLQIKHGSDILPKVCRDYPRTQVESPDVVLKLATLSCPEMARLVLSGDARSPLFDRREGSAPADRVAMNLWRLANNVLDQRQYPLHLRLVCHSLMLAEIAERSAREDLSQSSLRAIISEVPIRLAQLQRDFVEARINVDAATSGAFWHALFRMAVARGLLEDTPDSPFAKVLAPRAELTQEDVHHVVSRYRNKAQPIMRTLDTACERYFRVSLLHKGYPWFPVAGNYVATYLGCLIPYLIARATLWVIAAEGGRVEPADLQRAVYRAERKMGHSSMIYEIMDKQPIFLRLDRHAFFLLEA